MKKKKTKYKILLNRIYNKEFVFNQYPAPRNVELMNKAMDSSQKDSNLKLVTDFVRKWGLDNTIKPKRIRSVN